jgi:hypothetical protein
MINEKRTELLRFIEQQVHGPGALNNKYQSITSTTTGNVCEYLNGPPAKYYSTGILFPIRGTSSEIDSALSEPMEDDENISGEIVISENSSIQEEKNDVGDQTYPANMGITIALDENANWNDIEIIFEFRTYRKVPLDEARSFLGVTLEMNKTDFDILNRLFDSDDILKISTRNGLDIIHIDPSVAGKAMVKDKLYQIVKDSNYAFRDYFLIASKVKSKDSNAISINQIRARLIRDLKQGEDPQIRNSLDLIDRYSKFRGHIQNLLEVIDGDIWEGITHKVSAQLPSDSFIVMPGTFITFINKDRENTVYEGENSSLRVNYLISKDRRDNSNLRKYLKVQLYNSSIPVSLQPPKFYSTENTTVNERSFFGVKIQIKSKHLVRYQDPRNGFAQLSSEEKVNRFIYRDFLSYGIGHGTSVDWDANQNKVWSCYLPSYKSPDVDTTPRDKQTIIHDSINKSFVAKPYFNDNSFLEVRKLSTLSNQTDDEVIAMLRTLSNGYSNWINANEERSVDPIFNDTLKKIINDCRGDHKRIEQNITLLERNRTYLKLFRYMNTAMFMQMMHRGKKALLKDVIVDMQYYSKLKVDHEPMWRPFQLAFILLNLDSVVTPSQDTRDTVDLVWFPTGGGKTEAYLSLIAMTILYRRTTMNNKGAGTAVLMRYTLRLLALQQFQRATVLIMALELLRRWALSDLPLGDDQIAIGLWTGVSIAPNTLGELKDSIDDIKAIIKKESGKSVDGINLKGLVHQRCPWCNASFINTAGAEYTIDYSIVKGKSYLYCPNANCTFSRNTSGDSSVPIITCDEEIYRYPPALLFGTVDKFAALAHKIHDSKEKDSRRLFGNSNSNWDGKPNPLPPDLIIQDELHLISGPLGSATALVEIAIQELCMRSTGGQRYGAKIISSTATIRNSDEQVRSLYGKKLNLFPKPGIDADDSFFAFYKRSYENTNSKQQEYISKRTYLGIIPNGHSHMWMQLRLTAICLVHRAIFEKNLIRAYPARDYPGIAWKALDYYHTVLSYFNSLKELGKTDSQVNTYLEKEMRRVYKNVLYPDHDLEVLYTESISKEELTGRLNGDEVKNALAKVEMSLPKTPRVSIKKAFISPDFVLATNMISVGLDIARLNTMIVNSMPRNVSEYIQASSRVAREDAGLVVTVHHPYRTRDVSHFERFKEFHQQFYGYVEPISITPLTTKTMDKFLSLFIAIITRHKFPAFATRSSPNTILDPGHASSLKAELHSLANGRLINTQERTAMINWINQSLAQWEKWANENQGKTLVYDYPSIERGEIKLYQNSKSDRSNPLQKHWDVPYSLRSVEEGTVINIKPM